MIPRERARWAARLRTAHALMAGVRIAMDATETRGPERDALVAARRAAAAALDALADTSPARSRAAPRHISPHPHENSCIDGKTVY